MALVCVLVCGRTDAGELWTVIVTVELDEPESRVAPVASVGLDGAENADGAVCGGTRTVAAAGNLLCTASDEWLLLVLLQCAVVDVDDDAPSVHVQFAAFGPPSRVCASGSGAGARASLERLSGAAACADESRRALGAGGCGGVPFGAASASCVPFVALGHDVCCSTSHCTQRVNS